MASLGSKLVVQRGAYHSTMTEMNHLGAMLYAKPHVMESKFTEIFTAHQYSDNPLTAMLSGSKREVTIGSTAWEWTLKGASTRPAIVVEDVIPPAQRAGYDRRTFHLKLDHEWYGLGDILHPGTSDKRFQSRVQKAPQRHGNGWVYVMRMMNDSATAQMLRRYLKRGAKWGRLYSQYEEASEQSGTTTYSSGSRLMNRMSRYRKHYKVTGDAAAEVLQVGVPGKSGKMHKMWIKYAEAVYWSQWYREIERGYWYSRSTNTVHGANGRLLYTGPGIQEQLEDSHRHYYSVLSTKLIEEFLMDIFYTRKAPGSKTRQLKAYTGEYGMLMFHRAVTDAAQRSGFISVSNEFIKKTSSPYTSNGLSFGGQFTKYIMSNGLELELIHNPLYDDPEINFETDPVTGYPVESMRFTFLDFSGSGKDSNMRLVHRKEGFKHWYIQGGHGPYGALKNAMGAHTGDYYEIHVLKQCGVHIEDVTRCGELILKRQQSI